METNMIEAYLDEYTARNYEEYTEARDRVEQEEKKWTPSPQ